MRSLDGLRGLAALIVLVHHALLVVPALSEPYYLDTPTSSPGDVHWWLIYTPLHLAWAGTEAVYVFFVLSGFVLTLPALRRDFAWTAYYRSRLPRLYLPVIGAVALGYALAMLARRDPEAQASGWMLARPADPSLGGFMQDVTLLGGISGLISPLWSLQWEVYFSLLLPVYVLVAVYWPRLWPFKLLGVLAVVAAGAGLGVSFALYLPMFFVGALMAVHLPVLRRLADRIAETRHAAWAWRGLLFTAVLLCSSRWLALAAGLAGAAALSPPAVLLGASLLVFLAAFWPPAVRILEQSWAQGLGLISFSLYLLHEPIVIAVGVVVGGQRPWLALPATVLVALPAAAVFFRCVDAPSHRLARRLNAQRTLAATSSCRRRPTDGVSASPAAVPGLH